MEATWEKTLSHIKILFVAAALAVIVTLVFCLPAWPCTIAVVSADGSADGRPILWKNFDMSQYWHQQVKYFAGDTAVGGYYLLYHDNDSIWAADSALTPQAGVNDAGFSIVVAAVTDTNILNASVNANTRFLQDATANCVTVVDFENHLSLWHQNNPRHAVSANYAVIDAQGGAAMYEVYMAHKMSFGDTFKYRKYDANTGQVSNHLGNLIQPPQPGFAGYYVRSNFNAFFPNNEGSERALRAEELFAGLAAPGTGAKLSPPNIMRIVSKDVTGKQPSSSTAAKYSTTYCISRSQTRSGVVVEGVAAGESPGLTTFWAALGEPSISVFVPTFVGSGAVSPYLYEDRIGSGTDQSDVSVLNLLEDQRETFKKLIYNSNRGSSLTGPYDTTINKNELAKVQAWTFEIERVLVDYTREFLDNLRNDPSQASPSVMQSFQDHCAWYVYENYAAGSPDAVSW